MQHSIRRRRLPRFRYISPDPLCAGAFLMPKDAPAAAVTTLGHGPTDVESSVYKLATDDFGPEPVTETDLRWTIRNREQVRARALRAMNRSGAIIYAIRTPEGLIKIGCSSDVASRRRHLGSEILALKFGDRDDENALHQELVSHRARGREYYHPHPDVLAVVNGLRDDIGLDPIAA